MSGSSLLATAVLCLLLVHSGAKAEAAPIEFEGKATNQEDWEHLVTWRSANARFERDVDDTAHIVDFQEYYRNVFEQEWEEFEEKERELVNKLATLQGATIQGEGTHTVEIGLNTKPIKGRYIVMFQSDADDYVLDRTIEILEKANRESEQRVRATDIHALRNIGKGFTGTLNQKTVNLLTKHPLVAHIEEDMAVRRSSITIPMAPSSANAESHSNIPWNLDRLDQHSRKLNGEYLPEGTGKNSAIYIVDTGVMATHEELRGRVHYMGFDAVDYLTGSHNHGEDCQGHGTHCAATAAGKKYGVAKEAQIYNFRALNCQGTGAVSGIVMGIDKIITHHKENRDGMPAVISQSLGVKKSESLNAAIQRATDAGIVMVGAAGNQADYSCKYSPASAKVGIAVGATDQNDEVTIFSNTGECTDIMAPGTQITSASIACNTCTKTMSGTSMAAPHAAGYAAIIFSLHPQLSAPKVKKLMMDRATKGTVQFSKEIAARTQASKTPNRLLYVPQASAQDSDLINLEDEVGIQESQSRP